MNKGELKQIEGCSDYFAGRDGHVWSNKFNKWRKLKGRPGSLNGYLEVHIYKKGEKVKSHLVSRVIAETFLPDFDEKKQVDHINGIVTDNRIENLRIVTRGQNQRGFRKKTKNASSQYRGVSWDKNRKKWKAVIKFRNKLFHIGLFHKEIEAAQAFDKTAVEFGFFNEALNFPL